MSCGGSQPAGLCGLRKQVIEAKEGPLELRRQKVKVPTRLKRRKGGERPWRALESKRDRAHTQGVLCLGGTYLEASWEDFHRILTSFPGVSFQGHSLY